MHPAIIVGTHNPQIDKIKTSHKNYRTNIPLMYNPCNNLSQKEIEFYTGQIDDPTLIIRDFNDHHKYWNPKINEKQINTTGKSLFKVIQENNIILITSQVRPQNSRLSSSIIYY